MTANIHYEEREIEGERLELSDTSALYWLGPNLTLRRCTLILGVGGRSLTLSSSKLIDCSIQVKRQLSAKAWTRVALKGCNFKGRLTNCDFGPWYGYTDGWEQQGTVEDCDFSEARLDTCRFHGCDPSTLRLPRWPCFTILDPLGRAAELSRLTWPGTFGGIVIGTLASEPRSTVALSYYAPSVAKSEGTTPEQLHALFKTLDCIVM